MGWLMRWRCLIGLPLALIVIVVTGIVTFYVAPVGLRNALVGVSGQTSTIAKFLPDALPAPSTIDKAYWLPQNWSWQQRYWFHHTSQGTTTIPVPYEWFLALERPEPSLTSPGLLKDDDFLRRLGFIPSPSSKNFNGIAPQYGYLSDAPSTNLQRDWNPDLPDNRDGLPVGFARLTGAIDSTTGEKLEDQLGLTCAACHTGHLEYKNVSIRFDGGPAMLNLGEVEKSIGLAIGYTLKLPLWLGRFKSRLEAIQGHSIDRAELEAKLQRTLDGLLAQAKLEANLLDRQKADDLPEGFGRLDALNRIGNQVFFTNLLDQLPQDQAIEGNFARHNAPVSFPPIWDTPHFLWAQYDASVLNELVRNAGETLGVTARVNMATTKPGLPLFGSTIKFANLAHFEELLRGSDAFPAAGPPKFSGLLAPRWKDAQEKFKGDTAWALDATRVDQGRDLYRIHCLECHRGPVNDPVFDQKYPDQSFWKLDNPDRQQKGEKNWVQIGDRHYFNVVQIPTSKIGTDPAQSSVLTERRVYLPPGLGLSPTHDLNSTGNCGLLREEALNTPFVLALMDVVGKTIEQWYVANNASEALRSQMSGPRPNCQNKRVFVGASASTNGRDKDILAIVPHYRARPLDGVWATAPYLHNGSVPTLWDMLVPQNKRSVSFCIGSRQFDPIHVGLVAKAQEGDACEAGLTNFDVSLLGNSNRGHSFEGHETDITKLPPGVVGPELTDDERRSLVEYLKTL